MDFALLFFAWLAGMIAVPIIATERGRSGGGFLLLAFASTPLFAWAVLVSLRDRSQDKQRQQEHRDLMQALKGLQSPSLASGANAPASIEQPKLEEVARAAGASEQKALPVRDGWPAGIEWPVGIVIIAVLVAIAWAGVHGR